MPSLTLPPTITGSAARAWLSTLPADPGPALTLDPTPFRFGKPFGIALLVEGLAAYARHTGTTVTLQDPSAPGPVHHWLAHFNVFHALGSAWGQTDTPQDRHQDTYLPVTVFHRAELEAEVAATGRPLGYVIQSRCVTLAEVVTQKRDGKVVQPIAYCFRELIRNVFEHAEADRCTVCAQKTIRNDCVDIAVVDTGIGVRQSLSRRHPAVSDAEALRLALLPGRSGSPTFGGDDPYSNSGFGLYVLSELGRQTGSLRLISGDAAHKVSTSGTTEETAHWAGTAVELSVKKPAGVNFQAFIESIIASGEASGPERLKASLSTRLLPL